MRSRRSETSKPLGPARGGGLTARVSPLRIFVTGTDTGVGKTEASCALLSLLADMGLRPAPFKPYESGCGDLRYPADALALRAAAQSRDPVSRISVHRFRAALAPAMAAAREGRRPSYARVEVAFRAFGKRPLVVEGAGGLHVPVDSEREIIDLVEAFRLPVLLVARAGLGTLNHTALSLEALSARQIPVLAVLLVQSTRKADASVLENAAWIARGHRIPVLGPVPYCKGAKHRRKAFREALRPLVHSRGMA